MRALSLLVVVSLVCQSSYAGVRNGQAVSAEVVNAAFLNKNLSTGDNMPFRLGLTNTLLSVGSGVEDVQKELNSISSFLGKPLNTAKDVLPGWATSNRGAVSNNVKQRIEAIDAAFGATTGHKHTGIAGDAAKIASQDVTVEPSGGLVATQVQGALEDLQNALAGKQVVGNYLTGTHGDVTSAGPGDGVATVNSVGGSTAAAVHTGEQAANAATSSNTPGTIAKRDGTGTIAANLNGNATSATSVSGSFAGDISGGQSSTSVDKIKAIPVDLTGHTAGQALILNPTNNGIVVGTVAGAGGGSGPTNFVTNPKAASDATTGVTPSNLTVIRSMYTFTVTAANATVGATYTNNGKTFTVAATISGGTVLRTTTTGAPTASGTLTKTSGTGDATITFSTAVDKRIEGVARLALTSPTNPAYLCWDINPLDANVTGNCEADFTYMGDATKWNADIVTACADANPLTTVALTNETAFRTAILNYPCGAYKLRVKSNAASPAEINAGVSFGKATGVGAVTPRYDVACTLSGGFTTNTTYYSKCDRDGRWLHVSGAMNINGTPNAATMTLLVPNSLSIDTTYLGTTSGNPVLGSSAYGQRTGNSSWVGQVVYNSATSVAIGNSQGTANFLWSSTVPTAWGTTGSDWVSFDFRVPISGWSSTQTAVTVDTANSYAGVKIAAGASQSPTTASTSYVKATSTNVISSDKTHFGKAVGAITATAGDFGFKFNGTIPAGDYVVHGSVPMQAVLTSGATPAQCFSGVSLDGGTTVYSGQYVYTYTTATATEGGSSAFFTPITIASALNSPELTLYFKAGGPNSTCTVNASNTDFSLTIEPKTQNMPAPILAFKAPTVTTISAGGCTPAANCSGGNYLTPAGASYLKVKMVGGGGGGAGGGTTGATAGNSGGTTAFGTSLISATGGAGGSTAAGSSAAGGGSGTLNSPAVGFVIGGGAGVGGNSSGVAGYSTGMAGGASCLSGNGASAANAAGSAPAANSGSGGGGGGSTGAGGGTGGGGGAGGCVEAVIPSPVGPYPYSVGSFGSNGMGGTNGYNGASGAVGLIIVEEHYGN